MEETYIQEAPDGRPAPHFPPHPVHDRLVALFEVLACSDFPTQLLIAQILSIAGMRPFTAAHQYSAAFVFTLSLVDAVVLVGLVLWFLRLHHESPRQVLFGDRPVTKEALAGIALIPAVFVLALALLAIVMLFAPWLHNVASNPLEGLIRTRGDAAIFAVVAIVGGGIREEVQRAFILHRFEQHLGGARLGLLLFSILFGAGHLIQGWDAAIATATLGAFWGVIYLVRRSIVAPIVSHAGFNLFEILRFVLAK